MTLRVTLYALSTCGWCKKTKRFLEDHHIEYDLKDVDLLEGAIKEQVKEEVVRHNPKCSYPTLVVDGEKVVVGYNEEKLREILGLS